MSTMTLKAMLFGEDVSMGKAFKGAGKEAEQAGGKLQGLGGMAKAALTAGAVVAVAGFAKSSVDAFKEVGGQVLGLQRTLGGTPEEMSRLRFAAQESGVSYETLAKSTGKFEKAAVAAAQAADGNQAKLLKQTNTMLAQQRALEALHKPTQAQRDKLKALNQAIDDNERAMDAGGKSAFLMGIQVRDANGNMIPMAKLLPEVAEKFKDMKAGPEKTALAMKLFGKAGADMLPFLNRGKEGMKDLAKESDKFGLTLTGKNLQALKDAKKNQREWDASIEGVKVQFGAQLLPILTKFTAFLTSQVIPWVTKLTGFLKDHKNAVGLVATIVGTLIFAIKTWTMVQKILDAELFANPIGLVVVALAALAAGLIWAYKNVGWFRDACNTGFHAIAGVTTWLWNSVLAPVIRFLLNGFANVAGAIGHVLQALGHVPGFGWAKTAGDMMVGAANAASTLAGNIRNIPDHKDIGIHYQVTAGGVANTGRINVPGVGYVNAGMYASGGSNLPAGWKIVGEAGPELMYTPGGDTVIPAGQTRQILSGRGGVGASGVAGSGGDTFIVQVPPGSTRQQALDMLAQFKNLKRGGVNLGLA